MEITLEVEPSFIEVERCVMDHVGCSIFYSFGSHFILSYRGEPFSIEVEVGLVLWVDWCCVFAMALQCISYYYIELFIG